MTFHQSPYRPSYRKGFTLTEVAIVLGITGLIMGAVWGVGAAVSQSNKVTAAAQQMSFILQNYTSLFGTHGVDVAGDITCNGWNDNFFPPSITRSRPDLACTPGTYQTYPYNPWGGSYIISAFKSQGIAVRFFSIPHSACVALVSQVPNTPDIIEVIIDQNPLGVFTMLPITPQIANGFTCTDVEILYKIL